MKRSILLVDDEVVLLEALRRSLRKEAFDVHVAVGAQAAMDVLNATDIDVVISDDEMPGVTGVDFLSQIRTLHPGAMRIMLTGRTTVERMTQAVNDGFVFRFLLKPCPSQMLVEAVRHALDYKLLIERGEDAIRAMRRQAHILRWFGEHHPGLLSQAARSLGDIRITTRDYQTASVVADGMQDAIDDANRALEPKRR